MHEHHMRSALAIARTGLGRAAPNPSVGCVIVKNGAIVSRARTADGGRPHAERAALEQAGNAARGATLYVTLQPCSHHGQTPPCTDAIIKADIKTVVMGAFDPKMDMNRLQDAGIEVITGILEQECRALNAGFFNALEHNRPFITLKTACTLDGKIACASGESQWITGEQARRHTHLIRSQHDAILIGSGTALKDDPTLSTRLDGVEHKTIRIVLDNNLRLPQDSNLIKTSTDLPLWIFHDTDRTLKGAELIKEDTYYLKKIMQTLVKKGITRILVEGGATIHASFLKEKLWDEFLIYRAPTLLGEEHKTMMPSMNITELAQRYDMQRKSLRLLGQDVLETYQPKA